MFAETSRQKDRGTAHKLAHQASNILQENGFNNIVRRLQRESQVQLDHVQRRHLLRRIRLQYGKRSYPEETYEDWISGNPRKRPQTMVKLPKRKNGRVSKQQEVAEEPTDAPTSFDIRDFNDEVYDGVFQELNESRMHEEIEEGENAEMRAEARGSEYGTQGLEEIDPQESDPETSTKSSSRSLQANSTESSSDSSSETEMNAEEKAGAARASLKQWDKELNADRDLTRAIYIVSKCGLDPVVPGESLSVKDQHTKSIRTLLHLAIMDQKWDLAYKLYSLLIKIPGIKKRLLWTLGAEILQGKLKEAKVAVSRNPATGARSLRVQSKMLQDFLSWLTTSFSLTYWSIKSNTKYGQPFIGYSKTHAPVYAITLLWELLTEKSYSKVRDALDELLLKPPFSTHGLFHYMLAICCLLENIDLKRISQHFDDITEIMDQDPVTSEYGDLVQDITLLSSIDSIADRIRANASQAGKLLGECDDLGLEYPKDSFLAVLQETVEDTTKNETIQGKQSVSKEDTAVETPENVYFALKNGSLTVTTNPNFLVPRKIIDKLHRKKNSNLWISSFYSESQPMTCKVCNSGICPKSVNDLQKHLSQHDINSDNYASHELYSAPIQHMQNSESDAWPETESDPSSESEVDASEEMESEESEDIEPTMEIISPETSLSSDGSLQLQSPRTNTSGNGITNSPFSETDESELYSDDEDELGESSAAFITDDEQSSDTTSAYGTPMGGSEDDAQSYSDQSTIYSDAESSSHETPKKPSEVKVKEEQTSSCQRKASPKKASSSFPRETSFLARTKVLNSLLQDSLSETSEAEDDIDGHPSQSSQSQRSVDEFHSFLDTAPTIPESSTPHKPFNDFSSDSSFDNPDDEREVSQRFYEFATRSRQHAYFHQLKNSQAGELRGNDILCSDTSKIPEVPRVKTESDDDYAKSEANIFRVGEKDTWSDEYEEASEDDGYWWDTEAGSKGAVDDVSADSEYRNSSEDEGEDEEETEGESEDESEGESEPESEGESEESYESRESHGNKHDYSD